MASRKKLRRVELDVVRFAQPDETTCGPTCLAQVYRFFGDELPLRRIIHRTQRNRDGGTMAVFLGLSALASDYRATIYSYNLRVFDPTWKRLNRKKLVRKLKARAAIVKSKRLRRVLQAYATFLKRGGVVKFEDLSVELIVKLLRKGTPVITGLSATYLYEEPRQQDAADDDVRGDPEGHFLVISGYKPRKNEFVIRDPSADAPYSTDGRYTVPAGRLITAILVGDITYDANLLIVKRLKGKQRKRKAVAAKSTTRD